MPEVGAGNSSDHREHEQGESYQEPRRRAPLRSPSSIFLEPPTQKEVIADLSRKRGGLNENCHWISLPSSSADAAGLPFQVMIPESMEHGIENVLDSRTDFPLKGLDRLNGEMAHLMVESEQRERRHKGDNQPATATSQHARHTTAMAC